MDPENLNGIKRRMIPAGIILSYAGPLPPCYRLLMDSIRLLLTRYKA